MVPPATWHLHPDLSSAEAKGPLSRVQLESFFEDGYLFLSEFYDAESLRLVQEDVERMIDNLAHRLLSAGKIHGLYGDLDWTSRLLRMRDDFPDAPVVLIKGGILPQALQKMFSDSRILDIAAQLGVSPDMALNPAWNLRGKMPQHEETVVPWHQDNSYWEPRVWDECVLTVWVALVDATPENGCMQMVRGAHKSGRTATHTIGTTTSTWYTELTEEAVAKELLAKEKLEEGADIVTIPAKAGSVLIFPGTTPHRSLNSSSANIRWSCDWRLHRKTAQRPGKTELDWFYGLKDALPLRDGQNLDFQPEWASWATQERTAAQDEGLGLDAKTQQEAFDPVIVGPWMDLWDLETDVRGIPNQHVERYLQTPEETRNVDAYIKAGNW